MERIAIEGIDGSGKSTITAALQSQLESEGRRTVVYAPYREANARLGHDIYELWSNPDDAYRGIALLHKLCRAAEEKALRTGVEVLVYDRHWMTALVELERMPAIADTWTDYVPTALLRVRPDVALARTTNDHDAVWSTEEAYVSYAQRYEKLARRSFKNMLGVYRNDGDVSPQTVARTIVWDMNILR